MSRRRKPPRPVRFRRPRRAGSALRGWWAAWCAPLLLFLVLVAVWFGFGSTMREKNWAQVTPSFGMCGGRANGSEACVIDGDTLIIGFGRDQRRIRLLGFDAPELDGACEAERVMASRARFALYEWLSLGPFEWTGEADPPRDKYGRELREVSRIRKDGTREYLAETMIERGLAADNGWGASAKDWCT